jgi:hypothetical protein
MSNVRAHRETIVVNEVPKQSKGDAAHALVKAGLSAVPLVGGPAVELFQYVVQPPIERRRQEWMTQIGERLQELEAKGLDIEALQNNEKFITAVLQASTAALKTHQAEKLSALRNAVLHIAIGEGPEETVQHLLLSFVDELTEMHLRVLAFAKAPRPAGNISAGGLNHVLEENIPELRGHRPLYDQLWKDLYLRGLITTESLHVMMTGNGLSQSRTSPLGEALLNLIAEA